MFKFIFMFMCAYTLQESLCERRSRKGLRLSRTKALATGPSHSMSGSRFPQALNACPIWTVSSVLNTSLLQKHFAKLPRMPFNAAAGDSSWQDFAFPKLREHDWHTKTSYMRSSSSCQPLHCSQTSALAMRSSETVLRPETLRALLDATNLPGPTVQDPTQRGQLHGDLSTVRCV